MSAATAVPVTVDFAPEEAPRETTLLEVVRVLSEITTDEREIVATVLWMLRSGRIKLCGNFRDCPIEDFV
ncbi:MAG: hypothetical protein ACQGVC_06960 [Myxococcota bacterium]